MSKKIEIIMPPKREWPKSEKGQEIGSWLIDWYYQDAVQWYDKEGNKTNIPYEDESQEMRSKTSEWLNSKIDAEVAADIMYYCIEWAGVGVDVATSMMSEMAQRYGVTGISSYKNDINISKNGE